MNGEANEVELKFEIDAAALARLRADPRLSARLDPPRDMLSTYFDTEGRDLRDAGFTLRLRQDNGRWIQTIKSDAGGGLFSRGEWETEVGPGGGLDLTAAMGTPLHALLTGVAGGLKPLFATRVRRQTGRILHDGADIEVSFDQGEVEGDVRRTMLSEVELELKTGAPAALFSLAEEMFADAPLQISFVSKAERGYALVDGGVRPAKLRPGPAIKCRTPAGQAFLAICRLCLVQISANERVLRGARSPEAIHQLRIALRRLRSAMSTFKEVTADASHAAIKVELKWLAGELDDARNLDVFARESFAPAAAAAPADPGMAAFGERLLDAKSKAYVRAVEAVESDRCRRLLLAAARWIEAGEWASSREPLFVQARDSRVGRHARTALDQRLKSIKHRRDALDGGDPVARHRLRIRVKKLRYSAEFFAALYREKPQRLFIEALRDLQDALGGLNDIVVDRRLAAELAGRAPVAAFAAGHVSGRQSASEPELTKAARKAFRKLMKCGPYWR